VFRGLEDGMRRGPGDPCTYNPRLWRMVGNVCLVRGIETIDPDVEFRMTR
jgi:hypothetical protein